MRRTFCAIGILILAWVSDVGAEPLYLTASGPLAGVGYGSNNTYTFITPYFTNVQTLLSVSMVRVAATGSAKAPDILSATASPDKTQIKYTISCDLSSILNDGDIFNVSNGRPDVYNGKNKIVDVQSNAVTVGLPSGTKATDDYRGGATVTGLNCSAPGDTVNVTFSVTPVGTTRGYLYLRRNPFFSDTVNVGVGNDGMLSSSDSSSVQQITAILTEAAQTVGGFLGPRLALALPLESSDNTKRQKCYSALVDYVRGAPYYNARTLKPKARSWDIPVRKDLLGGDVSLRLQFESVTSTTGQENIGEESDGLVAFFPVPTAASILCVVTGGGDKSPKAQQTFYLAPPTVRNLYSESHILNPQRDFFTNPQDTFTFSAGIITGHKYAGQSPVKTVVDTLTAPVRALMPSVQVTQTTQVQTGGGKPDQTTTTTQAQSGPSKGP